MDIIYIVGSLVAWIVIIAVVLSILFVIPCYVGYRFCKKWRYTAFFVIPMLLMYFYSWFRAFYPDDSFYISQLQSHTAIEFDNDIKVLQKSASFPDHFGDYSACGLFHVSSSDLKMVLNAHFKEFVKRNPDKTYGPCYQKYNVELDALYVKNVVGEITFIGYNVSANLVYFDFISH